MRKIEHQMNNAISESMDWKSANTQVVNEDGISTVFLHNNKIEEILPNTFKSLCAVTEL